MFTIRKVRPGDWPAIAYLASDAVQEGDHGGGIDDQWVVNRQSPDCDRRAAVVELSGGVIGYCAVERQRDHPPNEYRVFAVADWSAALPDLSVALFSHLDQLLLEVGAEKAWMREVADDRELIRIAMARGFSTSRRYAFGGKELLNLEKSLQRPVRDETSLQANRES